MSETYTIYCDLDRTLPEDVRAGMTVRDDGEHIVFCFTGRAMDYGREIYVRPEVARSLASLLAQLADDDSDDALDSGYDPERDGSPATGCALILGIVAFVLALVSLFL